METTKNFNSNSILSLPSCGLERKTLWLLSIGIPLVVGPIWAVCLIDNSGFLTSVLGFQLIFLLAVSTITDIRDRKIFNFSTYSAILIAVAINVLSTTVFVNADDFGAVGIVSSLAGFAACFFVVFLAYQMTGCGAGDVKMAAAIGAMLGVNLGLTAVGYSYILAAVAALILLTWRIGPCQWFKKFQAATAPRSSCFQIGNADVGRSIWTSTIPMAPFFATGTLLAIWEAMI